MESFFSTLNNYLQIIKNTITSIINFIPNIFTFLNGLMDLLPNSIKISITSTFAILSAILIYKIIRGR